MYGTNSTPEQEANGPHRSPEKQFQSINTFVHDIIIPKFDYEREKTLSPF